jgi:putative YhdH/YhfP family quinone oxidoreductase
VVIKVAYSSLNFKDALSATGAPGVTKHYPHVPGIDAAGTVAASHSDKFHVNDNVLVTGYDLGSNRDGGYAEFIRVPSDWVVPLPQSLSLKESMILGTAGFTAALCVQALKRSGVKPHQGDIVVTGATGGVGSIAVALLTKEGYRVAASTGKTDADADDFLKNLGAVKIIYRSELNDQSGRPLLESRFAGAVDTVGGNTLTTALKSIKLHGSVAACGVVAGPKLDLTVFPFILRGVSLLGVDSAQCPMEQRLETWRKLASEWKLDILTSISQTISLEQLDQYVPAILNGKIRGRIVVSLK